MLSRLQNTESLLAIAKETLLLFYLKFKKRFHFVLSLTFLGAVIDVLGFTSIIPIIYLINDSLPIYHNKILNFVYVNLHFKSSNHFIIFLLIGLVAFFLLKNIILLGTTYIQNKFVYSVAQSLLERQISRFYNTEYLDIKKHNSVDYLRYIATTPFEFAGNVLMPFLIIFYEIVVIALIVSALLIYYPFILFLIFVTILPPSYILISMAKKKLAQISNDKSSQELKSIKFGYEAIIGFFDIKLFDKELVFIKKMKEKFNILYDIRTEENLFLLFPGRIIETLVIITVCVIYTVTSLMFNFPLNKLVLILLTFATSAYRLMPSFNVILVNILKIKTSHYIFEHLAVIKPSPVQPKVDNVHFKEKIILSNVSFKYLTNENTVLDNISITINLGDFVVITGESGSGKSTLGKILTGFVKPISGEYLIDNIKITNINQIKSLIGYVTQDFYLFDKSFLENIAIGEEVNSIDLDRMKKVIKDANLSEFVNTLPTGLNYVIGEMGTKLSGGQKQRIAIARALYKKSQILVLDEITSALDRENEMEILKTIHTISKKERLTVILITHSISALDYFDVVYELNRGKLVLKD